MIDSTQNSDPAKTFVKQNTQERDLKEVTVVLDNFGSTFDEYEEEEDDFDEDEELTLNLAFPNQKIEIEVDLDPKLSRNQAVIDYLINDEEEMDGSNEPGEEVTIPLTPTLINIVEPEEPEEPETTDEDDNDDDDLTIVIESQGKKIEVEID